MQRRQVRVDRPPTSFYSSLRVDSERTGRSVNDIASGILSSHYGHAYKETGRRGRVDGPGSGVVVLKIPEPVWFSLRIDAAGNPSASIRTRVIDIVSAHYDKGAA